jgi:hypothetical protein
MESCNISPENTVPSFIPSVPTMMISPLFKQIQYVEVSVVSFIDPFTIICTPRFQ